MSETFGQWLARTRKAAGFNQTELAERSRVTKATISLYESDGINQPRKKQVEKIAKALNVPFEEAWLKATDTAPPAIDNGFFKGIEKLSPERQALARRQIRAIIDALAEEEPNYDYIDDEPETDKQ